MGSGGTFRGGTHERVCRWEPVPLAVGHDPMIQPTCCGTQATWGQSITYLAYLLTTNMLICYLPWVPMRGGAHVLLLPRMPYGVGAARVPMRFYAILVNSQHRPQTVS